MAAYYERAFFTTVVAVVVIAQPLARAAEPTAVIEGQILTLFGDAIPDARVEVASNGVLLKGVQTDAKGAYRFADLAQGDYRITVAARAFNHEEKAVFLRAGEGQHLVMRQWEMRGVFEGSGAVEDAFLGGGRRGAVLSKRRE